MEVYDVIILGVYVGLCRFCGMPAKIKVIDSLDQVGGQLAALYRKK